MKRCVPLVLMVDADDSRSREAVAGHVAGVLNRSEPGLKAFALPAVAPNMHRDIAEVVRKLFPHADRPSLLDAAGWENRSRKLAEEIQETMEAYEEGDLCKVADGLVDQVVVNMVTALMMGLPWDVLWAEVVRALKEKERSTGADDPRSKLRSALDIVKPEGYREPDHAPVLGRGPWPVFVTGAES